MHWTKFAILVLCATSSIYYSSLPVTENWNLYNSNPNHPWNRLYRSLYLRVADNSQKYGYDELDPLLWYETKHLLSGPAYQQAIDLLDKFLATHAERLISDPLKRAILQRDLWAVF